MKKFLFCLSIITFSTSAFSMLENNNLSYTQSKCLDYLKEYLQEKENFSHLSEDECDANPIFKENLLEKQTKVNECVKRGLLRSGS